MGQGKDKEKRVRRTMTAGERQARASSKAAAQQKAQADAKAAFLARTDGRRQALGQARATNIICSSS